MLGSPLLTLSSLSLAHSLTHSPLLSLSLSHSLSLDLAHALGDEGAVLGQRNPLTHSLSPFCLSISLSQIHSLSLDRAHSLGDERPLSHLLSTTHSLFLDRSPSLWHTHLVTRAR